MTHSDDEDRTYRRYEDYEPMENQQGGVYFSRLGHDHGRPAVSVPALFSREFFRFFAAFLASPEDNPVFLREWRRNRRRLGALERYWMIIAIGITTLFALVTIAAIALTENHLGALDIRFAFFLVFFLPAFAASITGFIFGLRGCSLVWDSATLEELVLTRLRPQDIAFGHLLGGILPLSFPILLVLPSLLLFSIHSALSSRLLVEISPLGTALMALWFYPNIVASMLSSAAISQSISFGGASIMRPLLIWAGVSVLIVWPVTFYAILAWPYTFHLGAPALVAVKLLIMGAFLHHMAVRITLEQAPG